MTARQLRITSSPVTFEVFEALQACGPATVAELGPQLGRKANSLHYHMRKIVDLGLARKVSTRTTGTRTEVVYDLIADQFIGTTELSTRSQRSSKVAAVSSILRLAARNFENAAETPEELTTKGRRRDFSASRNRAWLDPEQLSEANAHIDALRELFHTNRTSQEGDLVALTMVMTPLEQEVPSQNQHT